jgi:hypothetical protein
MWVTRVTRPPLSRISLVVRHGRDHVRRCYCCRSSRMRHHSRPWGAQIPSRSGISDCREIVFVHPTRWASRSDTRYGCSATRCSPASSRAAPSPECARAPSEKQGRITRPSWPPRRSRARRSRRASGNASGSARTHQTKEELSARSSAACRERDVQLPLVAACAWRCLIRKRAASPDVATVSMRHGARIATQWGAQTRSRASRMPRIAAES